MNTVQRLSAWLLALVILALPVVAVMNGWIGSQQWPLRTLQVQGTFGNVSDEQVRQALLPYSQAGFLGLSLSQVQGALEQLPWVQQAQVRRQWPDTLVVSIVEHTPLAHWGQQQMVSVQGQIFPPPLGLEHLELPWLDGDKDRVQEVIALYQYAQALFVPWDLSVQHAGLDTRGSGWLVLNDGTHIVLGRQHIQVRLQRLLRTLPHLTLKTDGAPLRIDLRYPNGFAVGHQLKDSSLLRNQSQI